MPNNSVRIGVPQLFLSVDSGTALPDITAGTPVTCTAVAQSGLVSPLINDPNQPLVAGDTYGVTLGLVGTDIVNGGYTVGKCIAAVTGVTVTAGQGIYVHVANSAWPTNFSQAACVALFLKINNANYQLCQFAYLDPSNDFNAMIVAKPLRVAPVFSLTVLQAATVDPILGSRAPYGVTFQEITPTSGTFSFRRPVSLVTVSPNNAPDFQIKTSQGVSVSFESLTNDIQTFVRAASGTWVQYTGDNSTQITEGQMSLATAQAIIRGNRVIQVYLPPDSAGNQEVRTLLGTLTFNQQEIEEAWSKTAPTLVRFQFEAATLDRINYQFTYRDPIYSWHIIYKIVDQIKKLIYTTKTPKGVFLVYRKESMKKTICITCGKEFEYKQIGNYIKKFCSNLCLGRNPNKPKRYKNYKTPEQRFIEELEKVKKSSNEACWEWTGKIGKGGYGEFKIHIQGNIKKRFLAHRLSYSYYNNIQLEDFKDKCICHKCDNRKCINPNHLWLGTIQENTKDRNNKSRQAFGERNAGSKLNESQVIEMRKLSASGIQCKEIAKRFDVCYGTVLRVLNGTHWTRLPSVEDFKNKKDL